MFVFSSVKLTKISYLFEQIFYTTKLKRKKEKKRKEKRHPGCNYRDTHQVVTGLEY